MQKDAYLTERKNEIILFSLESYPIKVRHWNVNISGMNFTEGENHETTREKTTNSTTCVDGMGSNRGATKVLVELDCSLPSRIHSRATARIFPTQGFQYTHLHDISGYDRE
jgi:hypothetical protein